MTPARRFADGLHLAECPRWRDGELWASDMWGASAPPRCTRKTRPPGSIRSTRFADDDPGGLGWLPDGRLLVVGMERRVGFDADGKRRAVHAHPLAVVLGGRDRRTLFVCLADVISKPRRGARATARIDALDVDVPGAGRP